MQSLSRRGRERALAHAGAGTRRRTIQRVAAASQRRPSSAFEARRFGCGACAAVGESEHFPTRAPGRAATRYKGSRLRVSGARVARSKRAAENAQPVPPWARASTCSRGRRATQPHDTKGRGCEPAAPAQPNQRTPLRVKSLHRRKMTRVPARARRLRVCAPKSSGHPRARPHRDPRSRTRSPRGEGAGWAVCATPSPLEAPRTRKAPDADAQPRAAQRRSIHLHTAGAVPRTHSPPRKTRVATLTPTGAARGVTPRRRASVRGGRAAPRWATSINRRDHSGEAGGGTHLPTPRTRGAH